MQYIIRQIKAFYNKANALILKGFSENEGNEQKKEMTLLESELRNKHQQELSKLVRNRKAGFVC